MRTRLFVVTSLVVLAVTGAFTNAAYAGPKGPSDISQAPSTTTPPPQPKDKFAPKPTTTTTTPGPKGPGDLANVPKDDGDVDPGPDTTGDGSGSDDFVPPAGTAPTAEAGSATETENADAVAADVAPAEPGEFHPLVLILVAAVAGALLALLLGRFRHA